MKPFRAIALAWGLVAALTSQAIGHPSTQFTEYFGQIFLGSPDQDSIGGCTGCHQSLGASGGLSAGEDEDRWYTQLVNARSTMADGAGKLRVHPYLPWNSFLLEKLTGDVKAFEGEPMPQGGEGWEPVCPGGIDALYNWILDGASRLVTISEGVDLGMSLAFPAEGDCDRPRPPFQGLASPGAGVQIPGATFTIEREPFPTGGREGERSSYDLWTAENDVCVQRIEVAASAGTEYVTLTRGDDTVPFAVARGQIDPTELRLRPGMDGWENQDVRADLALPDGVVFKIAGGDVVKVTHRARNDYWKGPFQGYYNETDAELVVNFHTVDCAGQTEAQPIFDTTGTDVMFVPPKTLGVTGGLWAGNPPAAVSGALVGIWTDSRALEVGLLDLAGQKIAIGNVSTCDQIGACPSEDIGRIYTSVTDLGLPAGTIAYECVHSNGLTNNVTGQAAAATSLANNLATFVSRPQKYGCSEIAQQIPAGTPALVGGPAQDCAMSYTPAVPFAFRVSDCGDTAVDQCRVANLVGGPGMNDGRCSLVGLWW